MASLFNTRISDTYSGLIKTIDNAALTASLKELTDGSGLASGIFMNTAGDFKVTAILEFGSLKDTGENITISKFVDAADGIGNNDNDTTIPTTAAIIDYVAAQITIEDLDFTGDTGSGQIDLDSQIFAIGGTTNEITTVASGQSITFSLDSTGVNLPDNSTAITQTAGDNSTKIATTSYVDTLDAASDLDFSGDSGTGDVNLNTQTFAVTGTANQIESSASGQGLSLQFPSAGVTLPDGSVATTQSAGDNSTKVATTSYVDTLDAASDLDITDGTNIGDVNLNTQSLSILGTTNEIDSVVSGQSVTLGLPNQINVNVQGNLTGNVTGDVTGDLTGNSAGTHTGSVVGNVTGNVIGNVTGDLTGNADTATAWETARDLSLTGQATGTITSVDGTGNVSGAVTLDNNSVTSKVLTGLTSPSASSVLATDTIVEGFGKLQSQVNGLAGGLRFMGSWDASSNSPVLGSGGGEAAAGTTTGVQTNKLIDSTKTFTSSVTIGDQVVNQVDGQTALVTNVDSNTTLTLDADIMLNGEDYTIDNSPFITQGHYYVVSVGGSTTLNGISSWTVGDWVIAGANNEWTKLDHSQVDGTGTTGNLTKWSSTQVIADSIVSESGSAITVDGSLSTNTNLSSTGDFAVNTNKFTVAAASGNTAFTGDLAINTDKFTVNATTGRVGIDENTPFAKLSVNQDSLVDTEGIMAYSGGDAGNGGVAIFKSANLVGSISALGSSSSLSFMTSSGTTALTLDSSQNATFAGLVTTENKFQVYSTGASVLIGAVGNTANDLNIYSTTSGHNGLRMHVNGILPTDNTGTIIDNDADLGDPSYRFKDLYLGGSITAGRNIDLSSSDYTYIQGTHTGAADGEYCMRVFGYGDSTFYGSLDILRHDTDDGEIRFRTRIAGTATDVMTIVDGNVGIGTDSPDAKLSVNGIVRSTTSNYALPSTGGAISMFQDNNDYATIWAVKDYNQGWADVTLCRLGGNVGIGTNSPSEILQTNKNSAGNIVGGYFTNSQANTGAESVSLAFGLNRSGGDFVRQVKAITFGAEQQWTGTPSTVNGYLSFSTISNETVAERMRIDSSGNVGIGQSPYSYSRLSTEGSDNTSSNFAFIAYNENTDAILACRNDLNIGMNNTGSLRFNGVADNTHAVGYDSTIDGSFLRGQLGMRFLTGTGGGTERMRITSGGNIEQGTVGGTASAYYYFNATTTGDTGIIFRDNASTNSGFLTYNHSVDAMKFGTGGTERMTIGSTGRINMFGLDAKGTTGSDVRYNTSTSELYYLTSSKRYKTNIVNLESSLDKINALRPVRFKDIKTGEATCGLIAEETFEIIPDVVFTKEIEGFDEPQIEGLNYSDLVPFLIKSIQELKAEVDLLKQECKCK